MKFIENVKEETYINFFNKQKNAHFLQSYEWGQTQKEGRGLIPYYVGVVDDKDKLLACALLLKRKTPLNMAYFYAPRGFVIKILMRKPNQLKREIIIMKYLINS